MEVRFVLDPTHGASEVSNGLTGTVPHLAREPEDGSCRLLAILRHLLDRLRRVASGRVVPAGGVGDQTVLTPSLVRAVFAERFPTLATEDAGWEWRPVDNESTFWLGPIPRVRRAP